MKEIKALVHRHPDKLTIETMKSRNKGYVAEIPVVTYCHGGNNIDDMSKFRILLMIPPCLPEFWTAWKGAHNNRSCTKNSLNLE